MTKNQRIFHIPLPIILSQENNLRKKDYINCVICQEYDKNIFFISKKQLFIIPLNL
jgi:hypothetical protein